MKITTSPFVYRGVAVFMPEKLGNLQAMDGAYFEGSVLPGVIIGDCRIVRTTAPRRTRR